MFSLIITLVSIGLVAALAVAAVFYGGGAFTQGSAKASAQTLINMMEQEVGAATFHRAQTGVSWVLAASMMVPEGYLSSRPQIPTGLQVTDGHANQRREMQWFVDGAAFIKLNNDRVCTAINEQWGAQPPTEILDAAVLAAGMTTQYLCVPTDRVTGAGTGALGYRVFRKL